MKTKCLYDPLIVAILMKFLLSLGIRVRKVASEQSTFTLCKVYNEWKNVPRRYSLFKFLVISSVLSSYFYKCSFPSSKTS